MNTTTAGTAIRRVMKPLVWRASLYAVLDVMNSRAHGESRGDRELLVLVAKENLANRDALLTWRGQVEDRYGVGSVDKKPENPRLPEFISYAYDRLANKYIFTASTSQDS